MQFYVKSNHSPYTIAGPFLSWLDAHEAQKSLRYHGGVRLWIASDTEPYIPNVVNPPEDEINTERLTNALRYIQDWLASGEGRYCDVPIFHYSTRMHGPPLYPHVVIPRQGFWRLHIIRRRWVDGVAGLSWYVAEDQYGRQLAKGGVHAFEIAEQGTHNADR